MTTPLKVSVVGGLGAMASPMAKHWAANNTVQVLSVHDRGYAGGRRDQARKQWRAYGAKLVSTYEALTAGGLDGVFICAGKNGEDVKIISEVVKNLKPFAAAPFICHLSTVSSGFASAAYDFCGKNGVRYANYPLTGGSIGAEKGTLLILASGDRDLFDVLKPSLSALGTPKFFGEGISAGAEVKFMGHLMVFNGLIGITSAAALYSECFLGGELGGGAQAEFFDFLNTGAGGTRQWEVSLSHGIRSDTWDFPFSIRYAVIDAIYTLELCQRKGLSLLTIDNLLNLSLVFSYILNEVGLDFATQSVVRELVKSRAQSLDAFILRHSSARGDFSEGIKKLVASLPPAIQASIALEINLSDF